MEHPISPRAPLSPVLLAGLLCRPLPLAPLQVFLDAAIAAIARRHHEVFERLDEAGAPSFVIDAIDLPFVFVLATRIGADGPALTALRTGEGVAADAVIRGPLTALLDLLEGRIDGDSLFFSRALAIEGDTGAVVALRNAMDEATIDLRRDLLDPLGPLAGPVRGLGDRLLAAMARAGGDIETLRRAAIAPLARRIDGLATAVEALERRLDEARK
jgi:O2-independent ubiquinone biosynthesis accessory factor UbiT